MTRDHLMYRLVSHHERGTDGSAPVAVAEPWRETPQAAEERRQLNQLLGVRLLATLLALFLLALAVLALASCGNQAAIVDIADKALAAGTPVYEAQPAEVQAILDALVARRNTLRLAARAASENGDWAAMQKALDDYDEIHDDYKRLAEVLNKGHVATHDDLVALVSVRKLAAEDVQFNSLVNAVGAKLGVQPGLPVPASSGPPPRQPAPPVAVAPGDWRTDVTTGGVLVASVVGLVAGGRKAVGAVRARGQRKRAAREQAAQAESVALAAAGARVALDQREQSARLKQVQLPTNGNVSPSASQEINAAAVAQARAQQAAAAGKS